MSGMMLPFHASAAYPALINPQTTAPGSGRITDKTQVETGVETRVETPGKSSVKTSVKILFEMAATKLSQNGLHREALK